jgi:error-prone DNA polymerase
MEFLRALFSGEGALTCTGATSLRDGAWAKVAGVVLVRQRPGSAKGVIFMTIEDETGIANIVVWPKVLARYRKEIMAARLVLIEGRIQKSPEGVVHLVASRLHDRSHELGCLSGGIRPTLALSRADEILRPQHPRTSNHPRNVRILPKSRDFR